MIDEKNLIENNVEHIDVEEEEHISYSSDIFQELKNIYNSCLNKCLDKAGNGDDLNAHHNPKIAKKRLDFCKLLPCWSAIMVPIFNYGELTELSSTSESLFNEIKHRVFQHKTLPLRLDEFIHDHVSFITGSMNIIRAKTEYNKLDNINIKYENTIVNTDDDDKINQYDEFTNITVKEEIENENNDSILSITDSVDIVEN